LQNDPQYEFFGQLLKAPLSDAKAALETRYPYPRFMECESGGSQERFIKAKLNPSVTHNSSEREGEAQLFTEDVSLKVFMQHLRRLAVENKS
jgi:protein transport protein SEC23